MSEKHPQNGQKWPTLCALCVNKPQNRERTVSWATWLKSDFRGHLVHPQPPTFCGFQASKSPMEMPRPLYHWSLGGAKGQLGRHMVGANGVSTKVPGAKKIIFSRVVPTSLGMLKQVFLARFKPVVTRFGPGKVPKCLENGPFWDQRWVKNGSKTCFSKRDRGLFGVHKQVKLAHFEIVLSHLGPSKVPKSVENGQLCDQKLVKNASKMHFSKKHLVPFAVLKRDNSANFEPILTHIRPSRHMYAPSHTLLTYLRVSWSHVELGRGYYYTALPLNLANNKQASKQASKQQTSNKQHFSFPVWPLLRSTASSSTLLSLSQSLGGALAASKF